MDPLDTTSANPLNGYSVAIQACIDVAQGKSKSRLKLDAAALLLQYTALPPWVDFQIELVDEDE